MATTVYNDYYKNVSSGKINPQDVKFSVYICDESYVPLTEHKKADVVGWIKTIRTILIEDDISTLSMFEIIDKVKDKLTDEEYRKAAKFVVYDVGTQQLCFCEDFEKPKINEIN